MNSLKMGIQLLDFIEEQKYADAVEYLRTADAKCVNDIFLDLFTRITHCVGAEPSKKLLELTEEIVRYGSPKERVLVSQQLLLDKPSLPLISILLSVLAKDYDFVSERTQSILSTTIITHIEDYLLKHLESHEDDVYDVLKLSRSLMGYANHIGVDYRFDILVDSFTRVIEPTHVDMQEIISKLTKTRPYHPVIVRIEKMQSVSLIPLVHSKSHLVQSLTFALCDYLTIYTSNRVMGRVTLDVLERIVNLLGFEEIDKKMVPEFVPFFLGLLRVCQDMGLGEERVQVMKKYIILLGKFDDISRVIIIKRLIHLVSTQEFKLDGEAQVLAWLIDLYRKHLHLECYRAELGSIWSLIGILRYDNPVEATAFYVSLFVLAQHQALNKINKNMMKVVEMDYLKPIKNQISDFIELEKHRKRTEEEQRVFEMDYANLNMIISSIEMTENFVHSFIFEE